MSAPCFLTDSSLFLKPLHIYSMPTDVQYVDPAASWHTAVPTLKPDTLMQLSRRDTREEETGAAERKRCNSEMFGRRRSSSRRTHSQRGWETEAAGKRREGARWKIGEANKWGVTEGSTRLKINMIRQKTGDRLMEGNNREEGVGKWRQVQGEEDRKTVRGRQTRRMGEGGEIKPLTLVAVCGLLATVSAMHLFLSYWICTKQDVRLVIPESDRQYISCFWG